MKNLSCPRVWTKPLALAALAALVSACEPSYSGASDPYPAAGVPQPGGVPPAHGRTEAEHQAARDYYRGPRGDEF